MPILDLPQLHLPAAGAYLEAVMFCPRGSAARHHEIVDAIENEAFRNVLMRHGTDNLPAEASQLTARAAAGPRLYDVVKDSPHRLFFRRQAAAQLFLFVLSCAAANEPKEPATLEHARTVLGGAGGKYASYPGLGRSELIQVWQHFSPAVHLIAARAWFGDALSGRGVEPIEPPGTRLTRFLVIAEMLRLRGERHRPAHSKSHLLNKQETWKVPDWVLFPNTPDDALVLPHPARLRQEMMAWPHPRDVRQPADMSTIVQKGQ